MNIKRLLILDSCLRNNEHDWTLDDLIDACKSTGRNSKRIIQSDIETLRKHFNAPIIVKRKKYYFYSDHSYKLTDMHLIESNKIQIEEAIDVLSDYCKFTDLEEVNEILFELCNHMASAVGMQSLAKYNGTAIKLTSRTIRLWVDSSLSDKIIHHPLDKSQKIEQEEIDGSINIVLKIPVTKEFENFLILNDPLIRPTFPSDLVDTINKLISA